MGEVGSVWKDLTPKDRILGYSGACTLMVVLASKTQGFHDICLPNQCAAAIAKLAFLLFLNSDPITKHRRMIPVHIRLEKVRSSSDPFRRHSPATCNTVAGVRLALSYLLNLLICT